ncbi:hypothetical protein O181_044571 [Austropuccinia psidii MF-1]|uniref:Rho-GAP domain-containing protein n=1 Tax=Austropuccinia psidii MF-1 TaxID=1389203 RepID=A0A9Q3DIN1_9BASI|nr:hypothetical protein [Austropuccinia psidii MF-1]
MSDLTIKQDQKQDSLENNHQLVTHSLPKIIQTFERSFWTPDYRTGVTILFNKLKTGIQESKQLISFIRNREAWERAYAHQLRSPTILDPAGFGYDDGASFLSVFQQLSSSQIQLAEAHHTLALQLDRLVISPFETWSRDHEQRLLKSFDKVEKILIRWEKQHIEVTELKELYYLKTQEADDAEEDSKFSPATQFHCHRQSYPDSPISVDVDHNSLNDGYSGQIGKKVEQAIELTKTVTQKMRIGNGRVGFRSTTSHDQHPIAPSQIQSNFQTNLHSNIQTSHSESEKGKAKAVETIPNQNPQSSNDNLSNQHDLTLNISGIIKSPIEWSKLFEKARDTIYKQAIKVPILGTYPGAHSGEDLVIFFKNNLPELNGSTEKAIEFCGHLSQDLSILRLIGEIGNKFMATDDAFYIWKPDAFTLHESYSDQGEETLTTLPERRSLKLMSQLESVPSTHSPRGSLSSFNSSTPRNSVNSSVNAIHSVNVTDPSNKRLSGTGTILSKYFQTAVNQATKGINDLGVSVGVANTPTSAELTVENRAERLRREARSAEKAYSTCVKRSEHSRLMLEQTIFEHFYFLQRCELDRLRAAKAVIIGFNAALSTLNLKMNKLAEEANVLNESFSPEADISALIERYRTGPYRPSPTLFRSYRHQEVKVNFGIDLSKWHNSQPAGDSEFCDIPPVLIRLLTDLENKYPKISSHEERRKTWIYEVPLKAVHELREALNDPHKPIITEEHLASLDAPLVASTVKLWLLELDPPPVQSSRYDDVKAIYPQRAGIETPPVDARVDVLATLLSRLPKPHLMVIDAIISHLRNLVSSTKTAEDDEVYLMKLGLSLSRSLLRPKIETAVTLSDRFQPLFLVDLIKYYERVLPVAIGLRNKLLESGQKKLQRKSTRPIDMRVRRSELGIEGSVPENQAQEILENNRRRLSNLEHTPQTSPEFTLDPARSSIATNSVSSPPVVLSPPPPPPDDSSAQIWKSPSKSGEITSRYSEVDDSLNKSASDQASVAESESKILPTQAVRTELPDTTSSTAKVQEHDGSSSEPITLEEAQDAPFVPPAKANISYEPIDMPFVPPMKSSVSNEVLSRSYRNTLDEEDIPLSSKSSLKRISSGNRPSSLSRKNAVGSPRLKSGSKSSINIPSSIVTNNVPSDGTGSKINNSSFDNLRSQFEGSRKPLGSRTELSNDGHLSNRYRRSGKS